MAYSIRSLAKVAGVSTRTLRYYDQIGLLHPAYTTDAGYRMYEAEQVDMLQQILFFRALDMKLGTIKKLLSAPDFNRREALSAHLQALQEKQNRMATLVATIEKTIDTLERNIDMDDTEKFEGLKEQMLDDNEKKYGTEVRQQWGSEAYKKSNDKVKGMTQKQWGDVERLSQEINETLRVALSEGDPSGTQAQKACDLHRQWLCCFWTDDMYSKEAHRGLAQMYCDDPRFRAHYDKIGEGCAEFLRKAIEIYTR